MMKMHKKVIKEINRDSLVQTFATSYPEGFYYHVVYLILNMSLKNLYNYFCINVYND